MLVYKGFVGHIDFDMSSGWIIGEVLNAPDVILFQGRTAEAIEDAFRRSIDEYVAFKENCRSSNIVSFSGPISVHLRADQHAKVIEAALSCDKSVNDWCSDVLEHAASPDKESMHHS
ncbi:MAG: toxin-antitoxin system HicB family antitoxin [Pseudomonadota bacterium]